MPPRTQLTRETPRHAVSDVAVKLKMKPRTVRNYISRLKLGVKVNPRLILLSDDDLSEIRRAWNQANPKRKD